MYMERYRNVAQYLEDYPPKGIFFSLGKRLQSHAIWLGYNLLHDQKLLHCGGDVASSVYMERYWNVAQYLEDYRPNGIATNCQKYTINTAIHCLCYRKKHTPFAQKHAPIDLCFANTNRLVAAI
jgi:hypothetical protein